MAEITATSHESTSNDSARQIKSWKASVATDIYQHTPLDASKSQIRLLRVEIDDGGVATGCLEVHDLDSLPAYRALSYTWGYDEATNRICVNGHSLFVRANLYLFMSKNLWCNTDYIWIDQICIDQSSVGERNHQVQLMRALYSQAFEVVVWLNTEHVGPAWSCEKCDQAQKIQCYCPATEATFPERLLCNGYWDRMWIIQEFVRASKIVLNVDGQTLTEDEFAESYVAFPKTTKRSSQLYLIWAFRIAEDGYIDLGSAIMQFSGSACSEPRDKVYGIQALLINRDEATMIDYNQPIFQVFLDAIMIVIRNDLPAHPKDVCYADYAWFLFVGMFGPEVWTRPELEKTFDVIDEYFRSKTPPSEEATTLFRQHIEQMYSNWEENLEPMPWEQTRAHLPDEKIREYAKLFPPCRFVRRDQSIHKQPAPEHESDKQGNHHFIEQD